MKQKKIGILNSGGDCPGLNAVISGVVRAAASLEREVIGFIDGFEGLLPPGRYIPLDRLNTEGIMRLGGTMLGTTNRGHFISKAGMGEKTQVNPKVMQGALAMLKNLHIEALIVVGGDGSLTTAQQIFEAGFPIIGVPKTIDNDLEATAMTFGFDSAVACVVDALDRLHTTASSHKRVMVLEVMGRHAGWIALHGGLAGGADIILLPEIPFDYARVAEVVRRRDAQGALCTLIVVAERAAPQDGRQSHRSNGKGEVRLGGMGEMVSSEVARRTGRETRTCVLGHLQRGGSPTAVDRNLGICFGIEAVRLIEQERFGRMVSCQNNQVTNVPLADAVHRLRRVQVDSQMLITARAMEISFGDKDSLLLMELDPVAANNGHSPSAIASAEGCFADLMQTQSLSQNTLIP